MFDLAEKPAIDESIVSYRLYSHEAYTSRYENNDEIRIRLPEDLCTRPSDSYLFIQGRIVKDDNIPDTQTQFVNNGVVFLFSEIRYEVNGQTIDINTKPGITSTMKALASFNHSENIRYQNAGWFWNEKSTIVVNGRFNVCIPLKMLLGFAEDYTEVMVNIAQELILIRSNSDNNALITLIENEKPKVILDRIVWKVPHISPGLREEVALTKKIEKGKDVMLPFRSWQLHSYPALPNTTKHIWSVKSSTKLESPRYIILGFQTNREGDLKKDMSEFDHCDFANIRIFLNNERYPYENLNISFNNNQFATLYEMFTQFRKSYYYQDKNECSITPAQFKSNFPLVIVDCSYQKLSFQTQAVVLRIEFDTNSLIPNNTTAHAVIISDRIFTYNLQTQAVKQM